MVVIDKVLIRNKNSECGGSIRISLYALNSSINSINKTDVYKINLYDG